MADEIMPHVVRADSYGYRRTVWVDNLKTNRHYDILNWVADAEREGEAILSLSEAQLRYLHSKLGEIIAKLDSE